MYRDSKVPVGMTPVARFASWDEHRLAIHNEALYQAGKRAYQSHTKPIAV